MWLSSWLEFIETHFQIRLFRISRQFCSSSVPTFSLSRIQCSVHWVQYFHFNITMANQTSKCYHSNKCSWHQSTNQCEASNHNWVSCRISVQPFDSFHFQQKQRWNLLRTVPVPVFMLSVFFVPTVNSNSSNLRQKCVWGWGLKRRYDTMLICLGKDWLVIHMTSCSLGVKKVVREIMSIMSKTFHFFYADSTSVCELSKIMTITSTGLWLSLRKWIRFKKKKKNILKQYVLFLGVFYSERESVLL